MDSEEMYHSRKELSMRYMTAGKEYLQESPELYTQVDSKNLVQRYLQKWKHIKDNTLKVFMGTHLPVTV